MTTALAVKRKSAMTTTRDAGHQGGLVSEMADKHEKRYARSRPKQDSSADYVEIFEDQNREGNEVERQHGPDLEHGPEWIGPKPRHQHRAGDRVGK